MTNKVHNTNLISRDPLSSPPQLRPVRSKHRSPTSLLPPRVAHSISMPGRYKPDSVLSREQHRCHPVRLPTHHFRASLQRITTVAQLVRIVDAEKRRRMEELTLHPAKPFSLNLLVAEVQHDHFTGGRFRHGVRVLRWRAIAGTGPTPGRFRGLLVIIRSRFYASSLRLPLQSRS